MNQLDNDLIYNIIFDVPKDELIDIKKFSEGIKECLQALDDFNHSIVSGIDSSIEVVSYIQELKHGSVDFNLIDKIIEGATEGFGAAVGSAAGNYTVKQVSVVLKKCKTIWFSINQKKIEKKEKEKQIYKEIEKEIKNSKINNELKGYILNEAKIIQAVRNFAKGSKKIKDNVFFRENKSSEKIQINSSLNNEDENIIIETENQIERIEMATIRITKPDLDGKSMWQCYWNKKIKCSVEDDEFIAKIKDGFKIGSKMRFRVKIKIIEELDSQKNIKEGKEKYTLLKIEEIENFSTPYLF